MAGRRIWILAKYDRAGVCRLAKLKGGKSHLRGRQDPARVDQKCHRNSGPVFREERQFRPRAETCVQLATGSLAAAGRVSGP